VVLVRRAAGDLDDERREDRDGDQEDDERPAGQRDLVAAQPAPRDPAERAPFDLLLTAERGGVGSVS